MGFAGAIAAGFRNYVNFGGRATRPEYWYFVLFIVIVSIIAIAIDFAVFGDQQMFLIYGIFSLATFLPSLSVFIRRMHDTGRTGWWFFLNFIPLIGPILVIVWLCQRSEAGPNAYGPVPA
jgi:uncharacterized membrane protein YhaH (DUF805 family)